MAFIAAQPYDYLLPSDSNVALIIIDMQRDFLEPGGFGHVLGNDIDYLSAIIPTLQHLLAGCRALQLPIFHTVEGHKPDLSDCPPAKQKRGGGTLGIGESGADGSYPDPG